MNILYKNENDMFDELCKKQVLYKTFISEINKRGYEKSTINFINGELNQINSVINYLTYFHLVNLLLKSPRRLRNIISGQELLPKILQCPDDYKLVIDIDNIEDEDIINALVFKDIRHKFAYFKHVDECPKGISYIGGRWQNN